ncbi:MAG: 6-phosphogluconolactonase [bacterium]
MSGTHQLEVLPDADAVAARGAEVIAERAGESMSDGAHFNLAASGGRTPWRMYGRLEERDLDWSRISIFQTDERIAPAGSPERNLTHLIAALSPLAQASLKPMPVEGGGGSEPDLEAAAERYAAAIPERFDLIHLGLGDDGHTASLVPGDTVLEVTDRKVALTSAPYQGAQRMTLTYPALDQAKALLWIVTGEEKRDALSSLLQGDREIPAGRVSYAESLVIADQAAVG